MTEPRICDNCKQRPGTHIWSEGTIAWVHGCYAMWCDRCVAVAQLEHAVKMADTIASLREVIAAMDARDNDAS